jgi:hypothetical protein
MNFVLWFTGTMILLAGVAWGILTHFGLIPGGVVITPWLYATAFTIYVIAIGIRWPIVALGAAGVFATLMISIQVFDWLGLAGYV